MIAFSKDIFGLRTFRKTAGYSLVVLFAFVAIGTSFADRAMAFPGADEMEANFHTCVANDEAWYRRFGQYVVAFELYGASEACNKEWIPSRPHLAACRHNGSWIYAGYYCEEINSKPTN